jgi:hypothetical protein
MGPVPGHALISIALGITQKARKLRLYGSLWSDVLNAPIQSGTPYIYEYPSHERRVILCKLLKGERDLRY